MQDSLLKRLEATNNAIEQRSEKKGHSQSWREKPVRQKPVVSAEQRVHQLAESELNAFYQKEESSDEEVRQLEVVPQKQEIL